MKRRKVECLRSRSGKFDSDLKNPWN